MTTFYRNECVMEGTAPQNLTSQVMPHDEFINRIRKSLYYGNDAEIDDMEVSRPLAEYASELFSEPHKGHSLNRLNSVTAGNIHATPCSLLMALIYLDRLNLTDPGYVRRITPQELFIVSMMVSTKFYSGYDEGVYLSDWAEDGDITEERLKKLELEFLTAIDWNIYISNEQFFEKLSIVEKTLARREGLRRGWLTYSELMQMLPSFTMAKFLFNNFTVMAVSYAASVMTIAGAFFLVSQIPGSTLHRPATVARINSTSTPAATATPPDSASVLSKEAPLSTIPNVVLTLGDNSSDASQDVVNATRKIRARLNQSTIIQLNPVMTIVTNPNDNCNVLNIEEQLMKLERQHEDDAKMLELQKRNSEMVTDSHVRFPLSMRNMNKHAHLKDDREHKWLARKEEYCDDNNGSNDGIIGNSWQHPIAKFCHDNDPRKVDNSSSLMQIVQYFPGFSALLTNLGNCTRSMFWNLLNDMTNQPCVRAPFTWFKFI